MIAVSLNPSIDRGIEVPNFTIGAHQQGRHLFRRPAGKGVNLARTLGALHIPTMLIGFIGKRQQEYFERYINNDFVSCQLFAAEGKTRENITILDPENKVETHIRDQGFEITLADINKLRKKLALLAKPDTIVAFSGSLPPGMNTEDFLELVQICQIQEAHVCVDCSGSALKACLPLGLWMIKPNREELGELLGREIGDEAQIVTAGEELKKRITVALISLGAEGACLFSPQGNFRGKIDIDPAKIKNTVGAGDAMLAGFLAGIAKGKDARDCFAFALATATASTLSRVPGDIRLETLNKLFSRVKIHELD
jgi:1-phosphofructokinase family hexose kinase